MQDRFKFRIYCKSENKMMLFNNPTLIDGDILQGGLLFKNYDHKIKNVHEVKPEDLILMQCTGLKDKNNTLIFERDIIYKKGTKNHKGEKMYSEVIWDQMYAEFNISDDNGMHRMPSNSNNIEIIGNIYENPELLEDNKC